MAKRGPKTKYKEDFIRIADKLTREGLTLVKLADVFGVDKATLCRWMDQYPELCDTIKRARDDYDTGKVEKSLLRRALGFNYKEITREPDSGVDEDGVVSIEMRVSKEVRKRVVGDTTAMIFWLKNRQPQRWRDVKNMEHGLNAELLNAILAGLPTDYARAVRAELGKYLSKG